MQKSKTQSNRRMEGYKGTAPMGVDNKLAWFFKIILQVLFFTVIYMIFIGEIQEKYHNIFMELFFVFLWLIGSDILAYGLSILFLIGFNYKMNYITSKRKKSKNYNRRGIEYCLYTFLRCITYVSGIIFILALKLSPYMPIFLAYFLIWIFVFITSKLSAKIISIWITRSV